MSINIPLKVNNKLLLDRLDSDFNPKIGVKYCVVNKKNIIDYGISRPLGINSNKESIHAEIKALYNIKNKKIKIYIYGGLPPVVISKPYFVVENAPSY